MDVIGVEFKEFGRVVSVSDPDMMKATHVTFDSGMTLRFCAELLLLERDGSMVTYDAYTHPSAIIPSAPHLRGRQVALRWGVAVAEYFHRGVRPREKYHDGFLMRSPDGAEWTFRR